MHANERVIHRRVPHWLSAFLLASIAFPAHAQLTVDATVSPQSGGLFRYDFTISNGTNEDVVIVSVRDTPLQDLALQASLTAPTDFLAAYEGTVGVVDFAEATALFAAGNTVGGFYFDTAVGPGAGFFATFEALTDGGVPISGIVSLPEPATTPMLLIGALAIALRARRRGSSSPSLRFPRKQGGEG